MVSADRVGRGKCAVGESIRDKDWSVAYSVRVGADVLGWAAAIVSCEIVVVVVSSYGVAIVPSIGRVLCRSVDRRVCWMVEDLPALVVGWWTVPVGIEIVVVDEVVA